MALGSSVALGVMLERARRKGKVRNQAQARSPRGSWRPQLMPLGRMRAGRTPTTARARQAQGVRVRSLPEQPPGEPACGVAPAPRAGGRWLQCSALRLQSRPACGSWLLADRGNHEGTPACKPRPCTSVSVTRHGPLSLSGCHRWHNLHELHRSKPRSVTPSCPFWDPSPQGPSKAWRLC